MNTPSPPTAGLVTASMHVVADSGSLEIRASVTRPLMVAAG